MINHCDRCINHLGDTDTSCSVLFTYFDMIVSNTLNVKEVLKIPVFLIEQKIYPNHQEE